MARLIRPAIEERRITPTEKLLLADLLDRIPAGAAEDHPAILDVLRFGESLGLCWQDNAPFVRLRIGGGMQWLRALAEKQ